MQPIFRNILAVIAGVFFGSLVNMGIIMVSASIIPPPEGADLTTLEGLEASIHLFEPKHFLMPFLAHALGTFAGAWLAAMIAASNKMAFAMAIAAFFLVGGIINCSILPAPAWFNICDLLLAYLPMGYLAARLAMKIKIGSPSV